MRADGRRGRRGRTTRGWRGSRRRRHRLGRLARQLVQSPPLRLDRNLRGLNPHEIVTNPLTTRANAYTRFTIMSLVRCCLDFADAEFTRDTAESVPRARLLYLTALELLQSPEL